MWLLTHDGDLLEGKRKWLRPGQSHLFGRTRVDGPEDSEAMQFTIDNKSVSRKHLTIEVKIDESSWSDPFVTSTVILTDCSKFGTKLDGDEFKKSEITLGGRISSNESHTVQLGRWDKLFHLQWFPVTLALTSPSKSSSDPIKSYRPRLEPLDIKISVEYMHNKTTHVIAKKRNTPKGLQALVDAKHIVTDRFINALEEASIQPPLEGEVILSPLEDDFDGNWPNEMDYLPAPGNEPSPRSVDFFKPDPTRGTVFTGFSFVFCDPGQFDTLQPVITQGGGKALLYGLQHGTTPPDALASFVKGIAGDTGKGELDDGSEGRGVVVVRTGRSGAQDDQWILQFFPQVDLQLGQRSIEQNEFLDAILINNASVLRRALEEDFVGSSLPPPPYGSMEQSSVVDNDYNMKDQGPDTTNHPPAGPSGISASNRTSQAQTHNARSQGPPAEPIEVSDEEDPKDVVDRILPAATAIKRRRLQQQMQDDAAREGSASVDGGAVKPPKRRALELPSDLRKAKKSKLQDIDVKGLAKEHRIKEEEARRKDEEFIKEGMNGLDIESMRDLAIVEEMEIKPRSGRQAGRATSAQATETGWKEEWNGRKNFKKFRKRRHGENEGGAAEPIRARKVIIPLEEVNKENHGGTPDDYFVDSTRRSQGAPSLSQSQSQNAPQFRRTTGRRLATVPPSAPAVEIVASDDDDSDGNFSDGFGDSAGQTEQKKTQKSTQKVTQTQRTGPSIASSALSSGKGRGKRAVPQPASEPASKRATRAPVATRDDDDDDSDDGLKFRRRR
ncbi:hypothetical protein K490DRAFT_37886 [Saccharata proteae CBS 121410]|uniref:FHA domain-containing protein n=1 Tax=Saccharata proteae CBS 121410 TaxID=1314787 RepID=A0A6A5YDR8_9PEZI|nr:hypothetical protein K490DRAFT_37886 [Saccharata proteae CBS 121410]